MLVLMRKPTQVIHIGNDIQVVVTKVEGKCVSIGIEAPKNITILRGEVKERMETGVDNRAPKAEQPEPQGKRLVKLSKPKTDASEKGSFGKVLEKTIDAVHNEIVAVADKQ